ncbi:MAG: VanW family protein [Clostridiales bacterium]|nr:VanW family protein [Clostridiales bacterium]
MENNRRIVRPASGQKPGPELPRYMQSGSRGSSLAGARFDAVNASSNAGAVRGARGGSRNTGGGAAAGSGNAATKRKTEGGHGGDHSGGGEKRKKKTPKSQQLMRIALILFGVLILVIGGILLIKAPDKDESVDYTQTNAKFYNGVTIMGVNVGGKTIEEIMPQVQTAINTAMRNTSIIINSGDKSWSITAGDMNLSIDVDRTLNEAMAYGRDGTWSENSEAKLELGETGKDFKAVFAVDKSALVNRLNEISPEVAKPAVEPMGIPSLSEDNKPSFEFIEGENGFVLNTESTAEAIIALVAENKLQETLAPVCDELPPALTLDYIKANTQIIADFTTEYARSSSDELTINRCFNIEKAANIINCHTVAPGERWSFNDFVGLRTKEAGWKEANGISGGREYTRQYGGGICQVSTTLYGALLRGHVLIPDGGRKKHSIPSSYVDKGLDATVDSSGIDLFFENDTGAPLYMFAYIKQSEKSSRKLTITVSLYGKPLEEGIAYMPRSEVEDPVPRTDPVYVDDATIPQGYQLIMIEMRPRYKAVVYLDKLVNGQVVESTYLYTDDYRGNEATIHIGTGDPAMVAPPEGAQMIVTVPEYAPEGGDVAQE